MPEWDALAHAGAPWHVLPPGPAPTSAEVKERQMSFFELAILAMIFVGFFGLIVYAANHARSDDK